MNQTHETSDPSDAPPQDIGLRCLNCDYNLTGLTENRCPECNTPFDPDLMRSILAGEPFPVPIWDDASQGNLLVRFFRTCWMTWSRPAAFAKQMPWSFDTRSVLTFWLTVRAVVLLVILVGGLIGGGLARSLMMAVSLFVAAMICEGLLAFVAGEMLQCRVASQTMLRRLTRSWWGTMSCFSSFLILTAGAWPLHILSELFQKRDPTPNVTWGTIVGLVLILVWWSWCLGRAIGVRVVPGWRCRVIQYAIPGVALVSVELTFALGYALFAMILRS